MGGPSSIGSGSLEERMCVLELKDIMFGIHEEGLSTSLYEKERDDVIKKIQNKIDQDVRNIEVRGCRLEDEIKRMIENNASKPSVIDVLGKSISEDERGSSSDYSDGLSDDIVPVSLAAAKEDAVPNSLDTYLFGEIEDLVNALLQVGVFVRGRCPVSLQDLYSQIFYIVLEDQEQKLSKDSCEKNVEWYCHSLSHILTRAKKLKLQDVEELVFFALETKNLELPG